MPGVSDHHRFPGQPPGQRLPWGTALLALCCAVAAGRYLAAERDDPGAPNEQFASLAERPPVEQSRPWRVHEARPLSAVHPTTLPQPNEHFAPMPATPGASPVVSAAWEVPESVSVLLNQTTSDTTSTGGDVPLPPPTPPAAALPTPGRDQQPGSAAGRGQATAGRDDESDLRVVVPLTPPSSVSGVVESEDGLISIAVREAPLNSVLSLLAQQQGLSIVAGSNLTQAITVTLQPTELDNALDALLAVAGCTWTRRGDVIYVTPVTQDSTTSPFFQGRQVRVVSLNYVAADDVQAVVSGLLSPVGKVFIRQVNASDRRRTVEQIVIEDLPPFLNRATDYIAQVDQMPRQVMIEAHILQVRLGKDKAHGVNFDALARIRGARLQLWNKGFATDTGPGMVFTVDGTDFHGLIDCLTTTEDAKTLASPKVFAVNGQQSKIQIGRRLGYFVTTTTQTSTLQDVQFLEVGVVLTVTPTITDDGQVLMTVQPKVSSGDINPDTTLPEEETTEVSTSVMVPDGNGIIIGGLIQEVDSDRQSKLSHLGDLWLVGRLFQRRTIAKERNEVIVALLPRIVPCGTCTGPAECVEWERSSSRLLLPHLHSAPRPWEPELPDASHAPPWVHQGHAGQPVVVESDDVPDLDAEEVAGAPTPAIEPLPEIELLPSGSQSSASADEGVELAPSVPWSAPQ